jgi:hypothetical protein
MRALELVLADVPVHVFAFVHTLAPAEHWPLHFAIPYRMHP